jgi:NAD(P)H-dependent flavin oxidoreductase YrpB (nitropropane dioxygenase family)
MTFDQLEKAIAETKTRTTKPFGVNLRADATDAEQRIDLLINEKIKVASFARAPKPDLIKKLKDAGIVVIPSVGAVRHAEKVAAWGADAVLAQGAEAGGHTGSVATTLLIPSVVDAVDIPVIAAGGFFDGRGLAAALSYGAAGIAMGTRFLLTKESTVPDDVKQLYLAKGLDGTVVTKRVDGVPHRVLRTELVDKLERSGRLRGLIHAVANAARFKKLSGTSWTSMAKEGLSMRKEMTLAQVVMAANTPMLLRAGLVEGRTDAGVLAAGQVVGMLEDLPTCAELITGIMAQAEKTIKELAS